MADSRQSSAGVKNLRAMFENSAPTSPDSRGRSVSGNSSNGSSERPLSKVRSSFVAVEPSTAAKMSKSPQTGSPSASIKDRERRESFSLSRERDAETIDEIHKTISQEEEARRTSRDVDEVVPEQAVETAPPTAVATPLLAAIGKKPSSESTTETPTKQNGKKKAPQPSHSAPKAEQKSQRPQEAETKELLLPQPATPTPSQPLTNGRKPDPIESHTQATGPLSSPIRPTVGVNSEEFNQHPESSNPPEPSKASEQPEDTSNVPTTARATSSSIRTPSTSRTKPATTRTPSTQPNGTRNRQPSQTRSTRSSLASTVALPGNLDRGVGFVKPRPRSPTRPIKLPAHLVAPTTSSASKVRGAETTDPRVISPVSPRHYGTPSLRSSVGSVRSPKPTARNAWGPPPKKGSPVRKPVEKKEGKEVDRGFLERMMRPTASSAAKERGAGEGGRS